MILQIIFSTVASAVVLFLLTRLMGEKQISQMSLFDYVTGITIGSITAEMATELETPLKPLVSLIVFGLLAFFVSLATNHSLTLQKILSGRPLILLDQGKLFRDNFKKARLDLSEFLGLCRSLGYFDLSKIQTAILESNGALSILPVTSDRPATPSDLQLEVRQEALCVDIILDGRLNEKNLKHCGLDQHWLEKELQRQGNPNLPDIFLGTVDGNLSLHVFLRSVPQKKNDPFE